ncbi:type IIL restriction-modification enzyme MmeI, partial [Bifidobacterium pullorum]|uniref:type IIL restriction-modification enzyme MmeI n=1 Tax=Bifidobacterium pullorum TaxID=78448 RepID=UPI003F224203
HADNRLKPTRQRARPLLRKTSGTTGTPSPSQNSMKLLRSASSRLGRKFLDVRALHPERSLAEHYNPLAMAPELVKAHDALDREVDKAMGAARKLTSERQCQKLLFADYAKLTNN